MKKKLLLLTVFATISMQAERFCIDKIEAVIYTEEGTAIVTKSDVERMTLDCQANTLDDIIMEELMYQEAKKYKIEPDSAMIDRYLADVQRENNMSRSDLQSMFNAVGYTYEEGREKLGKMFAANTLVDFKVGSRLVVTEVQVKAYYDDHPVYRDAAYKLKVTTIPFSKKKSKEQQKEDIENRIRAGKKIHGARWTDPFWIQKADVAEEKQFLFSLKPGTISKPRETDAGFELFMMIDAHDRELIPLEDRYQEIVETLKKPMFEKLLKELQEDLLSAASIDRL